MVIWLGHLTYRRLSRSDVTHEHEPAALGLGERGLRRLQRGPPRRPQPAPPPAPPRPPRPPPQPRQADELRLEQAAQLPRQELAPV